MIELEMSITYLKTGKTISVEMINDEIVSFKENGEYLDVDRDKWLNIVHKKLNTAIDHYFTIRKEDISFKDKFERSIPELSNPDNYSVDISFSTDEFIENNNINIRARSDIEKYVIIIYFDKNCKEMMDLLNRLQSTE